MKIVSKGFVDGFYYKPRVDLELLEEYHEGIIALSACLAGGLQESFKRTVRGGKEGGAALPGTFSERIISFWNCRITGLPNSRSSISS